MFIFRLFWFLTVGLAKLFFLISFSFIAVVFASNAYSQIQDRLDSQSITALTADFENYAQDKLSDFGGLAQLDYSRLGERVAQFKPVVRSAYRF